MRHRNFHTIMLCVLLLAQAAPLWAAAAYTPRKGSAERNAIIEAIRGAYQKRFKKRATFEIWDVKIQNGWAGIYTKAELKGGKYGGNWSAVLRGSKSKWRVIAAYHNQENLMGSEKLQRRYPRIPQAVLAVLDVQ